MVMAGTGTEWDGGQTSGSEVFFKTCVAMKFVNDDDDDDATGFGRSTFRSVTSEGTQRV